ncbi:hypothetical protein [Streptosporangium sp. NPDC006930]
MTRGVETVTHVLGVETMRPYVIREKKARFRPYGGRAAVTRAPREGEMR